MNDKDREIALQLGIHHDVVMRVIEQAQKPKTWPAKIDQGLIEELFRLDFLAEAANAIRVNEARERAEAKAKLRAAALKAKRKVE